jgi:glycosyltransferase involved in cell wall biosynthesis
LPEITPLIPTNIRDAAGVELSNRHSIKPTFPSSSPLTPATESGLREQKSSVPRRRSGLQESVVFTGFRNDVPQIYRDLDVSVQASLNENLGGTIESLLMQCPTVATRVGGLTDSVVDGVTGVLPSPADPADLARGILRLLRDPKRARALGEAGRPWRYTGRRRPACFQDVSFVVDDPISRPGVIPGRVGSG